MCCWHLIYKGGFFELLKYHSIHMWVSSKVKICMIIVLTPDQQTSSHAVRGQLSHCNLCKFTFLPRKTPPKKGWKMGKGKGWSPWRLWEGVSTPITTHYFLQTPFGAVNIQWKKVRLSPPQLQPSKLVTPSFQVCISFITSYNRKTPNKAK